MGRYIKIDDCPHITLVKSSDYDEYTVKYKGLHPDRAEAMAYYTDDLEDALDTARHMEQTRDASVFDSDITMAGRVHWPDRWQMVRKGA